MLLNIIGPPNDISYGIYAIKKDMIIRISIVQDNTKSSFGNRIK